MDSKKTVKMTFYQTTALVVSGIIGSGILALFRNLAIFNTWGIIVWMAAPLLIYSIFNIFIRLLNKIKNKNGENITNLIEIVNIKYGSYISHTLSFGYFIAICASCAFVSRVFAEYSMILLPEETSITLVSVIVLLILFAINLINFGAANSILLYLTILKIAFFMIIGIFGLKNFGNYTINLEQPLLLLQALPIGIFAFFGFEYAVLASDSIENPQVNVPKATKIGLLFSTIVYLFLHLSTAFVLPYLSLSQRPVYEAACIIFGDFFGFLVLIVGMISSITTLNGVLVVQGNALCNMAQNNNVPSFLAASTKQGFAYCGAAVTILFSAIVNYLNLPVISYATILIFMLYLVCLIIDLQVNKLDKENFAALISIGLVMYSIVSSSNLLFFANIIIIYLIGFILQILNKILYKKEK